MDVYNTEWQELVNTLKKENFKINETVIIQATFTNLNAVKWEITDNTQKSPKVIYQKLKIKSFVKKKEGEGEEEKEVKMDTAY